MGSALRSRGAVSTRAAESIARGRARNERAHAAKGCHAKFEARTAKDEKRRRDRA